jgi:hypothetical protein
MYHEVTPPEGPQNSTAKGPQYDKMSDLLEFLGAINKGRENHEVLNYDSSEIIGRLLKKFTELVFTQV